MNKKSEKKNRNFNLLKLLFDKYFDEKCKNISQQLSKEIQKAIEESKNKT